jgi:hypothetical protein
MANERTAILLSERLERGSNPSGVPHPSELPSYQNTSVSLTERRAHEKQIKQINYIHPPELT